MFNTLKIYIFFSVIYNKIKNAGEYHDFYVQTNTLLLGDVFRKIQNMCLEIYELDSACFLTASRFPYCFQSA